MSNTYKFTKQWFYMVTITIITLIPSTVNTLYTHWQYSPYPLSKPPATTIALISSLQLSSCRETTNTIIIITRNYSTSTIIIKKNAIIKVQLTSHNHYSATLSPPLSVPSYLSGYWSLPTHMIPLRDSEFTKLKWFHTRFHSAHTFRPGTADNPGTLNVTLK